MNDYSQLKEDAKAREAFFMRLYQSSFPQVARYVSKMGGSLENARDVFQDSLIIYYEQVVLHSMLIRQSEKAYLYGIARHLWLKNYREHQHEKPLTGEAYIPAHETTPHYSGEKLLQFLEHAGKKCMELLQAVYYQRQSMKTIASQFGFAGERSATVQKYKCLEKVRTTIQEKAMTYEDFQE